MMTWKRFERDDGCMSKDGIMVYYVTFALLGLQLKDLKSLHFAGFCRVRRRKSEPTSLLPCVTTVVNLA